MARHSNPAMLRRNFDQLPELPAKVTTKDGQVVDVAGHVWRMKTSIDLPETCIIYWNSLFDVTVSDSTAPVISARAVHLIQLFTAEKMPKIKSSSAKNYQCAVLNLTRWLAKYPEWLPSGRGFEWSDMMEDIFNAWLTSEYQTNRKGHEAALVRSFYRWGAKKGFADFSVLLAATLDNQNLKGQIMGEVVASRDKRRGPFTPDEMDLIFAACKAGKGTDEDRAITWTLLETAIRPEQMVRLTNRDLIFRDEEYMSGDTDEAPLIHKYWLRVQIIKQRGDRLKYQNIAISEGCFQLLQSLCKPECGSNGRLFWWLTNNFGPYINQRLKAFFKVADLRSSRLPIENPTPGGPIYELIPVNPRRFRYSTATEGAARGNSKENISYLLCHTGTSSVDVYIETSPQIADDFQRATDYAILPLVKRMKGHHDDCKTTKTGALSTNDKPHSKYETGIVASLMPGSTGKQTQYRQSVKELVFPGELDKSEERIVEMIATARRRFLGLYPDQNFDDQVWNVRHLMERPNAMGLKSFGFTILTSTKHKVSHDPADALPAYFADVIKSWILLDGHVSVTHNAKRLYSARHLWEFLSERITSGEPFSWLSLTEDGFLLFEQYLGAFESTTTGRQLDADTILKIISEVQCLIYFLASRGICRLVNYIPYTASKRMKSLNVLAARQLAAEEKLPTPGVHEALADIYYRLTIAPVGEISDWTLICISAIAILMFTGIRLGELLTLPFDCEVEEKAPVPNHEDKYYYGIRYWVEKGRKKMMRVKWISPTAESIVRASVRRIKELTADARQRAKVLENNPTEVPLPADVANLSLLTRQQFIALLGLKDGSHLSRISRGYLPRQIIEGKAYYRIEDVKAFLLSRRVRELYTFRCDGTVQMLSESLLIVFNNQSDFRRTGTCDLLVEPLKEYSIRYFLTPATCRSGLRHTVFSEFGLTEKERSLTTHAHAFRHWVIHIAYRGGMGIENLLRYFEKRHLLSFVDYAHFAPEVTGAYLPDELRVSYCHI